MLPVSSPLSLPPALWAHVSAAEDLLARTLLAGDVLALGWPSFDAVLPHGGLPRGVIELSAPGMLACATTIALQAIAAAQRDPEAWCAWIDPEGSLYAPGVARAGVDLTRLLVVRPSRAELPRIASKMTASGAFALVTIDMDSVPPVSPVSPVSPVLHAPASRARAKAQPSETVRKLALASERTGTRVLLLADAHKPHDVAWPVAMRLDLEPSRESLSVRIGKERHGRIGPMKSVPREGLLDVG